MIKFIENFHDEDEGLILANLGHDLNKILIVRTLMTTITGIGLFIWSICLIPFAFLFDIIYYSWKSMLFFWNIPRNLFKKHFIKAGLEKHIKELDKAGYYRLSGYSHDENETLFNFIRNFLYHYKNRHNTKDLDNKVVCDMYRRRSVGDIYRICKTYYPDCTFHDVMKHLIKIVRMNDCGASYCNTIHKFVFHTDGYSFQPKGKVEYMNGDFKFNDIMKYYE